MGQNEIMKKFSLQEIVEIFKEEAKQITDSRQEAHAYASGAVRDFMDIYEGRIK